MWHTCTIQGQNAGSVFKINIKNPKIATDKIIVWRPLKKKYCYMYEYSYSSVKIMGQ